MKDFLPAIVGAAIRAVLQLAAGAGFVLAPDFESQAAAVVLALATAGWSFYQKKKAATP